MKITFIVQDLCGQGAQASTAATIREFVKRGWAVDLLLSPVHDRKTASGMYAFPVPENVCIVKMPSSHARGNVFFLRSYLKQTDADVVVSTSGPYHKCHALAKFGIRNRHSIHVMMDHGNWFGKEKRWWGNFVNYRFDRHFFVNSVSRDNFLRQYPQFPKENAHVVYNPCVDALFFSKLKSEPTHPWLKDKRAPTFISAGAFWEYKQQIVMLQAMNELRGKTDARLVLFGEGPLEPMFREYIKDHSLGDMVSIGGYSDNLPAEMAAADGYLMSSKTESFGIVIVEALAAGLHVISTDALYGPREILADGKYGDIVPVGDYREMADKILDYVRSPRKGNPPESWGRFTESSVVGYFMEGLGIFNSNK